MLDYIQNVFSLHRSRDWAGMYTRVLKPEGRYGAAGGMFPGTSNLFVCLGFAAGDPFDSFTYDVVKKGWYRGGSFRFVFCFVFGGGVVVDGFLR